MPGYDAAKCQISAAVTLIHVVGPVWSYLSLCGMLITLCVEMGCRVDVMLVNMSSHFEGHGGPRVAV